MPLESIVCGEFTTSHANFDVSTNQQTVSVDNLLRTGEDSIKLKTGQLNDFIAFEFSFVPGVKFVFTALRSNVFYVWIVVDSLSPEQNKAVYQKERLIIDEFQRFEFDFYLIAQHDQDVNTLISGAVDLAYQRL
jgi:hypothetical protein